ncbi:MAG TPA: heterodisulfide reductase-related iron-sulfur binding cluster, partial [Anaerolineales bacterium]
PLRDYLFGFIAEIAKIGNPFAPVVNALAFGDMFGRLREIFLGIAKERKLPKLAGKSLHQQARQYFDPPGEADCLLLVDAFNEYFYPQTGMDALEVLKEAGCQVKILRTIGAGRTLISKGFLRQARQHAIKLIGEITRLDPAGKLPVIGLEPSEIYTLKDEFLDLLPNNEYVTRLAERAYMIDEFLLRSGVDGASKLSKLSRREEHKNNRTNVLVHGHCYQKAQPPAKDGLPTGVAATVAMLEGMEYKVTVVDDGCCGMAGAFGYEAEHYGLSQQVGNLVLIPAIKRAEESIIAAAGISCQSQIEDGTGRRAFHPISLVARRGSIQPDRGTWK